MPQPLLVLVSGHPGAGKTTLGRALGDAMHLPHVNRDRISSGMWRTDPALIDDPRQPWEVFAETIERYLTAGASLVADQTLYRGMESEITARFVPLGELVNVHCRCPHAYDRWRAKIVHLPQSTPAAVAALEARVRRQRDDFTDPLDLGVPVIEVNTTDGYDPPLDVLVDEIERVASGGSRS